MDAIDLHIGAPEGSATQRAYLALRNMIVRGELPPGDKLKIEVLRNQLDTGASPIREALSLLVADNLVDRIDQRGFRAAEVSAENFEEILELRCTLEDIALRDSIARAPEAWEERIVLAHHRMRRATGEGAETFERLHKEFHMALISEAKSSILLKFCSQLYDLNIRYRYLAGRAKTYQRRDVTNEHTSILDACVERKTEIASDCLLSHYKTTGAYLSDLLGLKASD